MVDWLSWPELINSFGYAQFVENDTPFPEWARDLTPSVKIIPVMTEQIQFYFALLPLVE